MKIKKSIWIELILCIISLLAFMYPFISDHWNSRHSSKIITSHIKTEEEAENNTNLKNEVHNYNASLLERENPFTLDAKQREEYDRLLDIDGTGNIGYIEIDAIDAELPIFHGTEDSVLSRYVGHIEWSSLPVEGESTHAVLTAHNGLISRRLFTDLWKIKEGDRFVIHVLKEKLVYEVDRIKTVKPDELGDLCIEEGKDLVTLLTCTPYGVNTDRLLVRGHRVTENEVSAGISANAEMINKYAQAAVVSFIPLLIIIIVLVIKLKKTVSTE